MYAAACAAARNFPPSNIPVYIIVPNPSKSRLSRVHPTSPFPDEKFLRKYSNALAGAPAAGRPSQSSSVKEPNSSPSPLHFGVHFSPFFRFLLQLYPRPSFFSPFSLASSLLLPATCAAALSNREHFCAAPHFSSPAMGVNECRRKTESAPRIYRGAAVIISAAA